MELPSPVSAHDVARELRRLRVGAGQKQVHKWSYYAQAWHLVLTGRPLFYEAVEAYEHGPVVADLWKAEKYGWTVPPPADLGPTGRLVVELVLDEFGDWPAWKLEHRTHREAPWSEAWNDQRDLTRVIGHQALIDHFERTGQAAQVRERAFQRESADPVFAARVERIRQSSVHAREGRPIDANVLAAWNLGAIDIHNDPSD